ncbi:MAG: SM-20-related protein [Flavobacteriales bacterium]|jgi:SM-20-related protein
MLLLCERTQPSGLLQMGTIEGQRFESDQFEELIQGLIDNKFGCIENFVPVNVIIGLRDRLISLRDAGEMQSAQIGNRHVHREDQSVRGDCIKWLQADSKNLFEALFLNKISSFIKHLNRTCFTSIQGFESHYASYSKNGFYKRHLDQFNNDSGRKYSVVLYLNEKWLDPDGGLLSLYPAGAMQENIAPMAGRLVFFKSDEMEHEVFPSATRDRISIAGWLKG